MFNLFGKRKEEKQHIYRVWSLDHIISKSKKQVRPVSAEKKSKVQKTGRAKTHKKMLTRKDDLDALLEREKTLARKEAKKKHTKNKTKKERNRAGHGFFHLRKPKSHKPEKAKHITVVKPPVKTGQITTQIDEMLNIVIEKKRVKTDYLSKKLKVKENIVEEWAEILQDNGFITIHYPAFGKPELRAKMKKETES